MSFWTNTLVGCNALLVASASFASSLETIEDKFSWGGFITQGWTLTSENNFYGESSDSGGSFDFREIGLYGTYRLTPDLRISGQALSRLAGDTQENEFTVDHLLIDWSFMQEANTQAGVRAGRIKNQIGFYNDTREIAFSRPSALLPQSIYLDRIREIALSSDGVGGYLRQNTDVGYFSFDLQWGKPQAEENTEIALLGRDWNGSFQDGDMRLFRAMYETPTSDIRLAFTMVDSTLPYQGQGADPFRDAEVDFSVVGLSAQWNTELWTFTSEYMQEKPARSRFTGLPSPEEITTDIFYIQIDRRFTPELSGFVRFDRVIVDSDDRDGKAFAAQTGIPSHKRYARDWTLGLGYQPSQDWLFRAEWHHVEGTAWLSVHDNPNTAESEKHWDMLLLQASYRF